MRAELGSRFPVPRAIATKEEPIMKMIACALLALSVLTGLAANASAGPYEDSIWPYLDRDNRGGQSN